MPKVIVLALLILAGWQGPAPNKTASNGVQQETQANQASTPKSAPIARGTAADDQQNESTVQTPKNTEESVKIVSAPKIQTQSQKDVWDKALVVATWVLVGVGAFQIIFLWRTVLATKDNAVAAKMGAEATITENRPWLLIHREELRDRIQSPFLVSIERMPPGDQRASHCIFSIRNYGKTPARITAYRVELQIGDSVTCPPNVEVYATQEIAKSTYIFPPGESEFREARLAPEWFISTQQEDDVIRNHIKFAWLCGVIRYTDSFKSENPVEYFTKFCYLWETRMGKPSMNRWAVAGPHEYNEAK